MLLSCFFTVLSAPGYNAITSKVVQLQGESPTQITKLFCCWSGLHSIIHRKCKTHCRDISSKVCGCYMARLTLSKNSKSASLTTVLYRLFTLLSHDGDNNSTSVIMELWLCFVIMPEWYIKSNISFLSFSYLWQCDTQLCSIMQKARWKYKNFTYLSHLFIAPVCNMTNGPQSWHRHLKKTRSTSRPKKNSQLRLEPKIVTSHWSHGKTDWLTWSRLVQA